ncbi:MAG TPA: cytochrome c [Bryobacteraceae bacterium]|nr:cytochrome c [Bryobacteraceae bacterium]
MNHPSIPAWIATATLAAGLASPARAQQPPQPETTRLIQSIQGPALYTAYCSVCHGKDAKGGGSMAPSLKTPPPDLTKINQRNGGKFPLARVVSIISGEQSVPSGHGTREMPIWGPIFSQVAWDQDLGRVRVDNLAKYLETLQTK